MSDMGKILNSHTVQIERLLPGPIDHVWEYLTRGELIGSWLMPATMEPKLGGRVQLTNEPIPLGLIENVESLPKATFIRGLISEYDPLKVIAYSWNESTYAVATDIRFELHERGDQVLVVITHTRLPSEFMPAVAAGWHRNLDILFAILKGEKKPDFYQGFDVLLEEYKVIIVGAGVVIAATSASPAMALDDSTYKVLAKQRQELLVKYDHIWKDADEINSDIRTLEKMSEPDHNALNSLKGKLKDKYDDLHKIELDIRDVEMALK